MRHSKFLLAFVAVATFGISCETGPQGAMYGVVQAPIIGGTSVNDGTWPAVGGITLYPDSMCSGTLIAPRIVATAAHCVKGENPTKFTLGYDMDNGTDYTVAAAYYNPDYDPGYYYSDSNYDPGSNDTAVLVLSKDVTGVTPAELFTGDFTQFEGQDIIFVGYGKRSVSQQLYGLKYKVTLTIEDIDEDGFWNYTTRSDTHNTCGGDSGGPGFILSGGKYYIGGFVSSGDAECVEDGYNMRADTNAAWLMSMVEQYGGGSTGPVCGNGQCETGETAADCAKDCSAGTTLWGKCDANQECSGDMFCLQIDTSDFRCTVACDDLELGGGCPSQSMACYELQDGSGACVDMGLECGDGTCVYGETAESCAADCDRDCGDLTFAGCCDGTKALYCDNGQFREVECAPEYTCGWVQDGEYYFCADSATADPSGNLPMSCESFTFQVCGDGECTGNETAANCADDCGVVDPCGDGTCNNGETPATCPADCPLVDDCGNGTCDGDETNATCPDDCPATPDDCGNGTCDDDETNATCPDDCPATPDDCGNGTCDDGETHESCPGDCKIVAPDCGDDVCAMGEDCRSCPDDCGECPIGDDVIVGEDTTAPADTAVTGDDGVVTHSGGGCSAGAGQGSPAGFVLLFGLAAALFVFRRARTHA